MQTDEYGLVFFDHEGMIRLTAEPFPILVWGESTNYGTKGTNCCEEKKVTLDESISFAHNLPFQ